MAQNVFIPSKRFFGVPAFFNRAIPDGIFELLKPELTKFIGRTGISYDEFQLSLFPKLILRKLQISNILL